MTRSPGFWRGLAIASGAANVALLAWLSFAGADRQAPYVAVLADGHGRAVALAQLQPASGRLAARVLEPQQVPYGRTLHLWALETDGRPRSLGAIEHEGKTVFMDRAGAGLEPRTQPGLAISVEPKGAPFGEPTGELKLRGTWTRM